MRRRTVAPAVLLVGVPLLCFCAQAGREGARDTPAPKVKQAEVRRMMSVEELRRRYEAAGTEHERRAVCLQAIDQGAIYRGGPVSTLDAIFGTRFAADLPRAGETQSATVDFVPFVPSPDPSIAAGHTGWYLAIQYDAAGRLGNYYLTNLHK